jgi:PIN domain nuclease of toxin-antitoxin system
MLVLDTHVVVWWGSDPTLLGARARKAIASEERLGGPHDRLLGGVAPGPQEAARSRHAGSEWADGILTIPRIEALPLTPEIALMADGLAMHADPADRFVVATALRHGASLITKDRPMRGLRFVKTIW